MIFETKPSHLFTPTWCDGQYVPVTVTDHYRDELAVEGYNEKGRYDVDPGLTSTRTSETLWQRQAEKSMPMWYKEVEMTSVATTGWLIYRRDVAMRMLNIVAIHITSRGIHLILRADWYDRIMMMRYGDISGWLIWLNDEPVAPDPVTCMISHASHVTAWESEARQSISNQAGA